MGGILGQLRDIRAMLLDPGARFSISQTEAELQALEAQIGPDHADQLACQGELAFARGYLNMRQDNIPSAWQHYTAALSVDAQQPFIPLEDRPMIQRTFAKQYEGQGDWSGAAAIRRTLVELLKEIGATEDHVGGEMQEWAYCLHNAEQYDDALRINLEALEIGERIHGPDSSKLCNGLTNIAQNLHSLGRTREAIPHLQRWLDIGTMHASNSDILRSRFQLGVVHFEIGDHDRARSNMQGAVDHARSTGSDGLISMAQGWMDELDQRIAGAS